MPPARKRGSQEQGRQLQAYTACRCRGECRRRQMTTTSLHGSSSFVALNKRKGSTRLAIASEGVGYRRCRGCRRRQMTTMSLHGSLSLSLAFVVLKKRMKKPTPSRNCKRGGGLSLLSWVQTEADDDDEPTWLVVVIVVRCLKEKDPPRLAIASEGVGDLKFCIGRNPPRLAVACKGVGFCHLYCTVIVSNQ